MFSPAYLDHNATTPLDPRVLDAMLSCLGGRSGNASSRHEYGRQARKVIDEARQQVAAAAGAHPTEVIFTSGGSEANNLFIKGAAACLGGGLLAISAVEHSCVREPAHGLQHAGWRLHEIAVDAAGCIDPADYAATLAQKPRLISAMLANNETGVIFDVAALATQARESGAQAWFHTDAVQAFGKIAVDFRALNTAGVHGMTLSAHKIGGPQGAGALILDKRVELAPLISGGGQERGLRSGTENVAAIAGFGAACTLIAERRAQMQQLRALRDELEAGVLNLGAIVFGKPAERLPNTTCFALPGIDGETLVGKLDRAGFAVGSGAACSATDPDPSHVLRAMGVSPDLARGAVRVSLGIGSDARQVADFLAALGDTIFGLRRLAALAS